MEKIEITIEKALKQIEIDRAMIESLKASTFATLKEIVFYEERIGQLENILTEGHGIFSTFKNEKAYIILK